MESEYRSDCICRTLHQDIPSSREIRQKESTLNVSRGSTNGKPCSEAQEQEPDNGIKDNAESSKENPESAGIRFPVIALGTRCREVMKIIDVAVRNQDAISPVLVRKADRNDMVHLHRLFQHDAPAIRTEVILAHESGMGSNVLIAVVVRPLIFRFLDMVITYKKWISSRDAPAACGESGILPEDGPGTSTHQPVYRCSVSPTHAPRQRIPCRASAPR